MSKNNFVFHFDFIDTEEMTVEEIGLITLAIINYSKDGKLPAFEDRALRMKWKDIKEHLDSDRDAYEKKCQKNRENGRLGGAPKGNDNAAKQNKNNPKQPKTTERFQKQPKQPDSESDSDSESDIYINSSSAQSAEELFERLWKEYPNKRGKSRVSVKSKQALFKHGYDLIHRCIMRYQEDLKVNPWRSIQNGSTFFTSGYVDYLADDYKLSPARAPNTPKVTGFNNFKSKRVYNTAAIEAQALRSD